jgi:hypothetical protein
LTPKRAEVKDSTLKSLGNVRKYGQWQLCINARHTEVSKEDPSLCTMFIKDDVQINMKYHELDAEEYLLKYELPDRHLAPDMSEGQGCLAVYKFTVPEKERASLVSADFHNNRVPFLKKLLA